MHTVTGVVMAVQEQRFRLMTDSGQNLLLTLHNLARLPASLPELQRSQAPVRVTYQGQPNLSTGIARRIDLL